MTASESPSAYDNRQWTLASDEVLLQHLLYERIRLENDDSLMPRLLDSAGPTLDYGCGAGLVAGGLIGVDSYAFDTSPVMRASASRFLPSDHVFGRIEAIPDKTFERIWCCLVLCIVEGGEVGNILKTVRKKLTAHGRALFTICNPALCTTKKTRLDLRFPGSLDPDQEGLLPKWKLESADGAGYGVYERHRPLAWYEHRISEARLQLQMMIETPHYDMDANNIPGDFLCFQCVPA